MMWLKGMNDEGKDIPTLRKIAQTMTKFKSELNDISQVEGGDRSLRVDKEDF